MFIFSDKKVVGTWIAVLLVIFFVGVFVYKLGYRNGIAQAKDFSSSQSTEQRLVVGVVEKISGQEITIKNFQKIPPNTVASSSERMVIHANSATIVERIVQKDAATIESERALFLKKVNSQPRGSTTTLTLQPPDSYTVVKINPNDIKPGDTVSAFADRDISKLMSFTAIKIDIQVAPATPNVPKQ